MEETWSNNSWRKRRIWSEHGTGRSFTETRKSGVRVWRRGVKIESLEEGHKE